MDSAWFEWVVAALSANPHIGVMIVFLLCGLGLPLPEEIVLVAAGFVCFRAELDLPTMMLVCAGAILTGDIIPFVLGRYFGSSLLSLRPMRLIVTPERLARFDRWFRRRGDLVIFFSRFVAGIRVVSFFTAGTMKTRWSKFILLDGLGIAIIVPPLVYAGHHFGSEIDSALDWVNSVENGILITVLVGGAAVGIWYWLRWRRKQKLLVGTPAETYVEPSEPIAKTDDPATAPEPESETPTAAPRVPDDAATAVDPITPGPAATPQPDANVNKHQE